MVGIQKLTKALNQIYFAGFSHAAQTGSQLADDFFFVTAQHIDIDFRLRIRNTVGFQMAYFINHRRIVQQGFRRNTAHVQAHTAQSAVLLDNRHFQAFIGCGKSSGITAGAAAQYHYVVFGIRCAAKLGGLRCSSRFRRFLSRCGGRCSFRFRGFDSRSSFDYCNHTAFGNFVAYFNLYFFHHTGRISRYIHGGFVGFQGNQGIFKGNRIAGFDFYRDDVHIFIAADIGDF